MIVTNFLVKKRKISQIDSIPYTGEDNIDTFKFEFDEEWNGLDKTLVIVSGSHRYNIALLHDECVVPFEFYQIKGNVLIGLFGTDGTYQTLATGWLPIYVEEDSYEVGVEPDNLPSQTQWDAFVTEINNLLEQAEASEEHCAEILAQMQEDYETYLASLNQIKDDTEDLKDQTQTIKNDTNQIKTDVQELKRQIEQEIAGAELKISEYNANAQVKTNEFNNNATSKTNIFNQNATDKTNTFNNNATQKTSDFNDNATSKTNTFNQNAQDKIDAVTQAGTTAIDNIEAEENTAIAHIEQAGASYDERLDNLEAVTGTGTDTFSTDSTYAVGDVVVHDNKVYRCITAITTAGAWDSTKWEEINVRQEQDEQNEKIAYLQEHVDLVESNYNTDTAIGSDLDITDALNGYNQGIVVGGNTTQDTSKRTYVCVGTESGDYYFTYDNVNYQFTMPTVSAGDILVFNTTTLKLYLGETEITTTIDNTGTLITLSATPNPNFAVDIVDVTGTQEVVISNNNFLDESVLLNSSYSIADGIYKYTAINLPKNVKLYCTAKLKTGKSGISGFYVFISNAKNANNQTRGARLVYNSAVQTNTAVTFRDTDTIYLSFMPTNKTISEILDNYTFNVSLYSNTDYVPHKGSSVKLHLGDIHLGKSGNYGNYLYKENGKWYLYQGLKTIVFNGTEDWSTRTNSGGNQQFYRSTGLSNPNNDNAQKCNYARYSSSTYNYGSYGNFQVTSNDKKIYINVRNDDTTDAWKARLAEKNLIIVVSTSAPTVTEITSSNYPELYADLQELDKIQTYREHTIIQVTPAEGNTGNPAQLEITYLKDDRVSKEDFELLKARVELLEE